MDIANLVAQQTLARAFGSERDNELKIIQQVHAQTMQREGIKSLYETHQNNCSVCYGAMSLDDMCYVGRQAADIDARAAGQSTK